MTSRPDEGERRRYAALMRELIALAQELRRGFGVVSARRSIADVSAQTLSINRIAPQPRCMRPRMAVQQHHRPPVAAMPDAQRNIADVDIFEREAFAHELDPTRLTSA